MARLAFAALPALLCACSVINAPADVDPGSGGAGGTGASTPTSSSTEGGGATGGDTGGGGGTGGNVMPVCNNGMLEGDEECDDGNEEAGDACSIDCKITQFVVEVDATV